MSRRSSLIVLAVLSLVATLLAVSAVPAAGEDYPATYSACVGPATESAGFEDVPEGSVSEAAINCMAHYGIMPGASANTFSPTLGVTRQAMALFLIRSAGPAGIDIPKARDEGFRDIDDLPRSVRDAINQLVALDITRGTTSKTFSPDDLVTRRQMVQFLARFLDEAPVGEGGVDIEDVDPDDDQFVDIDDLPHGPYDAIRNLFEMGVTNGTSRTRFSPDRTVTRAQMAMFISRMLAHTNARPAGVTMQAPDTSVAAGDTAEVVISVRNSDFEAAQDVFVDLFHAPSRRVAFDSGGRCYDDVTAAAGDQPCVIDFSDTTTDSLGNLVYDVLVDASLVLWVWTGDRNDRFDADRTQAATLEFSAGKAPDKFKITYDIPEEAIKVPFGRSVTVTFQLVDEDDNPASERGAEIRVRSIEKNGGRVDRDRSRTLTTDSSGQAQLRFRQTDPDSRDGDPDATLDLTVERADYDWDPTPRVQWSDEDEEARTLVAEQSVAYHYASNAGQGVYHTVTATLYDQYGDPVRSRQKVSFKSNDPAGLSSTGQGDAQSVYRKSVSSRGVARVGYWRRSTDTLREIIEISMLVGSRLIQVIPPVEHYWVGDPRVGEPTRGLVLHHDEDRNTLVFGADDDPYVITYHSSDQFIGPDGNEVFSTFAKEIGVGDNLTVTVDGSRGAPNRLVRG